MTLVAGLGLGFNRFSARAASAEVRPPMPPEVCALLRPELLDRLVPPEWLRAEFPEYYAGLRARRLRVALILAGLVIVGLMGWPGAELGERLGPGIQQLQIAEIDRTAERPDRPALPDPPFARPG